MLRGRDGVHQWESPGGLTIVLNELDDLSTGDAVYPRFRLVDVDHGYPEAGDNSDKRVGAAGSIPRASYRGPRTHVYTIEVYGRTIDELREGEQTLRGAFFDQSAEGRMDVNLHPLHDDYDAGNNRFFNARAMALTPGTDAPDSDLSPSLGFRREWVLALRNHDGRYFEDLTLATFKQAIVDLGPSLYWALDSADGADDLSGNGRDGTGDGGLSIGGAAALTAIPGDSATNFDGADDYIYQAAGWNPHFTAGGVLTWLAFISLDSDANNDTVWSGASASAVPTLNVTGAGPLRDADVFGVPYADCLSIATPLGLAVVVNDTTEVGQLYINGEGWGEKGGIGWNANPANQGNFILGTDGPVPTDLFDGKLSHVAVFERELTAQEIATVYEWASTGLRAYW